MSLAYNPYGLIPTAHESGIVRPAFGSGGAQPYGGYTIASGYANNIFLGSPIQIDTVGNAGAGTSNLILVPAVGPSVVAGSLTAQQKILGSFQGVEFTLGTGRRTVSPFWPAGTVPFAGSPTVAWITRDPRIRYEIQANGSVPATAMGNLASITPNGSANGNTTTGFSTVGLDPTTLSTNSTPTLLNQLRIVGFSQRIDNLPGDAFTQVVVEIALHQDLPIPGAPY